MIESIQRLDPVVIYFRHADVAGALRAACDKRGSEWEAYQINWKLGSPYAKRRSLQGFDGLVRLYQEYVTICDDIFAQLTLPKLALRNNDDWTAQYRGILAFLRLPAITMENR